MKGLKNNLKDYVIVAMVEPQEVGHRFTMWPLHITLLPWFSAPSLKQVEEVCKTTADVTKPFTVDITDRAYFGQRRMPVKLVECSNNIVALHNHLLRSIQAMRWEIPGRYVGEHFKPHVTQKQGVDAEGPINIDALYIAEKLGQGYRQIVSKVDL